MYVKLFPRAAARGGASFSPCQPASHASPGEPGLPQFISQLKSPDRNYPFFKQGAPWFPPPSPQHQGIDDDLSMQGTVEEKKEKKGMCGTYSRKRKRKKKEISKPGVEPLHDRKPNGFLHGELNTPVDSPNSQRTYP